MPRTLRLAPIAVTIAIVAAGCGSSNNSGPSKAKLIAEADPICKQVAVKRAAANTAVQKAGSSTAKTLQVLARVAPPVAQTEHNVEVRLRQIKPPASLAADWKKLLTGMNQLANDASEIGVDAKDHEYKEITTLTAAGRKLRQSLTEIATRDGFTYCGRTS